jgi:hypothetical protein
MFGTVVESCNIFILPQPSLGFFNARPLPQAVLTCLDEGIIEAETDPIYPKFAVKVYCDKRCGSPTVREGADAGRMPANRRQGCPRSAL